MVELSEKVEELTYLQSKLTNTKLTTTPEDFKIAKENIDTGSNSYTDTDFKNT
jgi:2-C-methyl-D-erythritol 4-phosphate cytidylyltransferase